MNIYFTAAAALAFAALLIHSFSGSQDESKALEKPKDKRSLPWLLSHFSWYLVALALLGIIAIFSLAATEKSVKDIAWIATFLTGAFCVFGLIPPFHNKRSLRHLPQGWFLLPTLLLGIIGGMS